MYIFRPVVAMTLILNIVQFVVAKFAFLQERGEFLAINNRYVSYSTRLEFLFLFYVTFSVLKYIYCMCIIEKDIFLICSKSESECWEK